MKKLFAAALLAVTMGTSAFALETNAENKTVRRNFAFEFKGASNVIWSDAGSYAKAAFTLNNEKMEAFYNADGEVVATSKSINLNELPVAAKRTFSKRFEGYAVKEAIRLEGTDEAAYFVSAENDQQAVIIKIDQFNQVKTIKTTKK